MDIKVLSGPPCCVCGKPSALFVNENITCASVAGAPAPLKPYCPEHSPLSPGAATPDAAERVLRLETAGLNDLNLPDFADDALALARYVLEKPS